MCGQSSLLFVCSLVRTAEIALDSLWTTASFSCFVHVRICPWSRAYSKRSFVNAIVPILVRARYILSTVTEVIDIINAVCVNHFLEPNTSKYSITWYQVPGIH